VHLKVRLEEAKACVLVLISVRADGSKELVAIDSGYRESGESWAGLLRDAERRRVRAPVLAVGDGALGFWKALRENFPDPREQRCWVHKRPTSSTRSRSSRSPRPRRQSRRSTTPDEAR
jgi:transposase-like protein